MMTVDEVLAAVDSNAHPLHPVQVLAAEVRRLRDEVNGLTGKLERAESVLQNLMSYLSVNGCRTEIDPENAELRIRDGINMLVRPALERAERAEKALKEPQEQEPVLCHAAFSNGDGTYSDDYVKWPLRPHEKPVCPVDRFFYARPVPAAPSEDLTEMRRVIAGVADRLGLPTENGNRLHDLSFWLDSPPAVAVPAVPEEWLEFANFAARFKAGFHSKIRNGECPCWQCEVMRKARALLQSAPHSEQFRTSAKDLEV